MKIINISKIVPIIFIIFLILLTGCKQDLQQTVIEKEKPDNENQDQIIEEIKEEIILDESGEDLAEKMDQNGIYFESGKNYSTKFTAAWAHSIAYPQATKWNKDARLFQISGINIKDGKITNEAYYVSDQKFYQSYYLVKYISKLQRNKEILEIRVDVEGAQGITKTFLPEEFITHYQISEWKYDSDSFTNEIDTIKQGLGYYLKTITITPVEFLKIESARSNKNYIMNNKGEEARRLTIYSKLDNSTPIALMEVPSGVIYEININNKQLLGYYTKRN